MGLHGMVKQLHKKIVIFVVLSVFTASAVCFSGCSPYYTWGYAKTIHPASTHAYILAVLARENGDYQTSVQMYDEALRHTWSDRVAAERNEVAQMLKNTE